MNRHNPARPALRAILIGCALLLLLPGPSAAPAMEQESVEADGVAAIQSGNLAQARDLALSQALRNALEKVIAASAPPDVLAGRKTVLNEKIYPSTERYIVRFRILREVEQDGAYAVKIAATVDAAGLKEDLHRYGIWVRKSGEIRGAGFRIAFVLQGSFASHHDYLAFRDLVSGIPGVQSVTPVLISPDASEWLLETSEKPEFIARELSKRRFKGTTLRIVQSGVEVIFAAFNSKGGSRD